jgi:tetratricopeptide (TPR) repeat protein
MIKTKFLLLFLIFGILNSCNTSNESKADQFNQDGNTTEAIKHYVLAIKEGSNEAINKLALLYDNNHKPEKAKEYYIKSYKKGNLEATKYLMSISLRDNNYLDVIKYGKPNADKGNKEFVYDLGSAYVALKQYNNAIKYLKMDENNVYIKDILGTAYYEKGDLKNAENCWKTAVDNFQSGAINSYSKLIKLYQEQGRTDDYNTYLGKY